MRRLGFALFAVACLALGVGPASAKKVRIVGDDTLPFVSGNVSPLLTLPVGKPVGVRFRDHYMFVTGTDGLTVYDITNPAMPTPVGALPLPHFENEDVDLGGNTLLISNDPSETAGVLYVIDISNPALPTLKGAMVNGYNDGQIEDSVNLLTSEFGIDPVSSGLPLGIGHTASCVDKLCHWAYLAGTSRGIEIVDLRNPAQPTVAGGFVPVNTGTATHDVQVDGTGLAWIVGYQGTAAYDVTDPLHPKLVARSDEKVRNTDEAGLPSIDVPDDPIFHFGHIIGGDGSGPLDFIHHDSLRLGTVAGKDDPKGTRFQLANGDGFDTLPYVQKPGQTYPAGGDSPVFGIVEEDYTRPTCQGAGSFQTWGATDKKTSTGAQELDMLDQYSTELNKLTTNQSGWAPVDGLCSAHYFDYRDGIVAGGWYEEGTRFLDVRDPTNIKQIGYWVPSKGETWSVAFAPTDPKGEIVYALDYTRGIDVLRLDRSDLRPRQAPVRRSWLLGARGNRRAAQRTSQPGRFGWVCRLL
jgi:hypothetical protein